MDISSSINLNLNFRDSISVTELNYLIKSILDFEPSLQEISVLGEVSNTRVTPKKHIFFNLIDQSSSIPCVMWSSDLNNGGEGAPLAPIFHKLLVKQNKIKIPVSIINIGGISNITSINNNFSMYSRDIGPGNCLFDKWIRLKSKKKYDEKGSIARSGTIDKFILNQSLDNFYNNEISKKKSFDTNDFDLSFARGLNLENGAATLTEFTADICSKKIASGNIYVSGGGRKNLFLIERLEKKTNSEITLIDEMGIDGDFIESQAFAYLAVRSFLKLPISFPETTGCSEPCSGGKIFLK